MTPSNEDVILFLKGARSYVEQGWTQGASCRTVEGGFKYCAAGATDAQLRSMHLDNDNRSFGFTTYYQARRVLHSAASEAILATGRTHYSSLGIIFFNDVIAKSKKDVLAVYDRAIEMRQEAE